MNAGETIKKCFQPRLNDKIRLNFSSAVLFGIQNSSPTTTTIHNFVVLIDSLPQAKAPSYRPAIFYSSSEVCFRCGFYNSLFLIIQIKTYCFFNFLGIL